MIQQSTIQTDPLTILAAHEAAHVELARVKRFTGPTERYSGPLDTPQGPDWPQMAAVKERLAALPAPPSRGEAITACLAELQAMAVDFSAAWVQLKKAFEAELQAAEALEVARIRRSYALAHRILGLPTAHKPVEDAQAALDAAENHRRIVGNKRANILRHFEEQYPGADLARPETWQAAAAGRVDRTWGEFYESAEARDIKTRLGLTDKMLARLVKV